MHDIKMNLFKGGEKKLILVLAFFARLLFNTLIEHN